MKYISHIGEGVVLLGRSVLAYEAALEVYTRADHPVDWAMTQMNLGISFETMGELDLGNVCCHLKQALLHVGLSLEVFDPIHLAYNFEEASRIRQRIEAKLTDLK